MENHHRSLIDENIKTKKKGLQLRQIYSKSNKTLTVGLITNVTHNYKRFYQDQILLIVTLCVEQTQFWITMNTKDSLFLVK